MVSLLIVLYKFCCTHKLIIYIYIYIYSSVETEEFFLEFPHLAQELLKFKLRSLTLIQNNRHAAIRNSA